MFPGRTSRSHRLDRSRRSDRLRSAARIRSTRRSRCLSGIGSYRHRPGRAELGRHRCSSARPARPLPMLHMLHRKPEVRVRDIALVMNSFRLRVATEHLPRVARREPAATTGRARHDRAEAVARYAVTAFDGWVESCIFEAATTFWTLKAASARGTKLRAIDIVLGGRRLLSGIRRARAFGRSRAPRNDKPQDDKSRARVCHHHSHEYA